jgi:hypothetical protein
MKHASSVVLFWVFKGVATNQERWLALGQVQVLDIVKCFAQARSLRKAAVLLNVHNHPSIVSNPAIIRRGGPSKLHPLLTEIFYGCTMENVYRSLKAQANKDKAAKGTGPACLSLPNPI